MLPTRQSAKDLLAQLTTHPFVNDLPSHWEWKVGQNGRIYFQDHETKSVSRLPPAEIWTNIKETKGLPYGWEEAFDDEDTYFIDHLRQRTTRLDPRIQSSPVPKKASIVPADDKHGESKIRKFSLSIKNLAKPNEEEKEHKPQKKASTSGEKKISLSKDPQAGYGFQITQVEPFKIAYISPGGPAVELLHINDILVEINGKELAGQTKAEIDKHLSELNGSIEVTVLPTTINQLEFVLGKGIDQRSMTMPSTKLASIFGKETVVDANAEENNLKVYLEDGNYKSFLYTHTSNTKDIIEAISNKLGLQSSSSQYCGVALKSMKGRDGRWLGVHDIISMLPESKLSEEFHFYFRLRCIPTNFEKLRNEDEAAFNYLYHQSVSDAVSSNMHGDLSPDLAVRLAAIQLQHWAVQHGKRKIDFETIDDDVGAEYFASPQLLEKYKIKALKKKIAEHAKPLRGLSMIDLKMRYLEAMQEIPSFGGRYYNGLLNNQPSKVLVNAHGLWQITNIKTNERTLLAEMGQIAKLQPSYDPSTPVMVDVVLHGKERTFEVLVEHGREFWETLDHYHKVIVPGSKGLVINAIPEPPPIPPVPFLQLGAWLAAQRKLKAEGEKPSALEEIDAGPVRSKTVSHPTPKKQKSNNCIVSLEALKEAKERIHKETCPVYKKTHKTRYQGWNFAFNAQSGPEDFILTDLSSLLPLYIPRVFQLRKTGINIKSGDKVQSTLEQQSELDAVVSRRQVHRPSLFGVATPPLHTSTPYRGGSEAEDPNSPSMPLVTLRHVDAPKEGVRDEDASTKSEHDFRRVLSQRRCSGNRQGLARDDSLSASDTRSTSTSGSKRAPPPTSPKPRRTPSQESRGPSVAGRPVSTDRPASISVIKRDDVSSTDAQSTVSPSLLPLPEEEQEQDGDISIHEIDQSPSKNSSRLNASSVLQISPKPHQTEAKPQTAAPVFTFESEFTDADSSNPDMPRYSDYQHASYIDSDAPGTLDALQKVVTPKKNKTPRSGTSSYAMKMLNQIYSGETPEEEEEEEDDEEDSENEEEEEEDSEPSYSSEEDDDDEEDIKASDYLSHQQEPLTTSLAGQQIHPIFISARKESLSHNIPQIIKTAYEDDCEKEDEEDEEVSNGNHEPHPPRPLGFDNLLYDSDVTTGDTFIEGNNTMNSTMNDSFPPPPADLSMMNFGTPKVVLNDDASLNVSTLENASFMSRPPIPPTPLLSESRVEEMNIICNNNAQAPDLPPSPCYSIDSETSKRLNDTFSSSFARDEEQRSVTTETTGNTIIPQVVQMVSPKQEEVKPKSSLQASLPHQSEPLVFENAVSSESDTDRDSTHPLLDKDYLEGSISTLTQLMTLATNSSLQNVENVASLSTLKAELWELSKQLCDGIKQVLCGLMASKETLSGSILKIDETLKSIITNVQELVYYIKESQNEIKGKLLSSTLEIVKTFKELARAAITALDTSFAEEPMNLVIQSAKVVAYMLPGYLTLIRSIDHTVVEEYVI